MAKQLLTPKQEEFTRLYFKLGNATEAYKQSQYSSDNMKETTIARNAHTLLNNSKILAMLDGLKKAAAKTVIITKEQIITRLSEIGSENDSDRVSAYKQICKVLGFEAPTKQELTVVSPFEMFLTSDNPDGD